MMIDQRSSVGHAGWLVAAVVAAAAGGCDFRPSAPETRAEYFVEKLVREPQALEDLRAVSDLPETGAPDDLLADLPTHTAVMYLRARAQFDAELGFHVAGTARPASDVRRVDVVVSEGIAVANRQAVRFNVELKKIGEDWRVVRVRAD